MIKQEQRLIPKSNCFVGDQFKLISPYRKQLHRWVAWFLHGFAITPDNSVQNAIPTLRRWCSKRCIVIIDRNIQQKREKRRRFSNYPLQNHEGKRVVLKSSSTKRNDSKTNHGKKLYSGLQNLIDESADSKLNWNGIILKFNCPCGFILTTYLPYL